MYIAYLSLLERIGNRVDRSMYKAVFDEPFYIA
jgi:hypothetical protein